MTLQSGRIVVAEQTAASISLVCLAVLPSYQHSKITLPHLMQHPLCLHTILTLPLPILACRLARCSLRPLFALNPTRLSPRCSRRALRLLHLLLAFRRRLLLLACLDGFLTCRCSSFWSLRTALFDYVERGTHDTTLLLDRTARPFLSDFLQHRN